MVVDGVVGSDDVVGSVIVVILVESVLESVVVGDVVLLIVDGVVGLSEVGRVVV